MTYFKREVIDTGYDNSKKFLYSAPPLLSVFPVSLEQSADF